MEKRGIFDTFDGAAIVWSDPDPKDLDREKAAAASQTCLDDERHFLDLPRSAIFTSSCAYSEGSDARPAASMRAARL